MKDYFLGWDVGGWNCDRNRNSRDTLCALTLDETGEPILGGRAWRGNLRDILTSLEGAVLIHAMLERVEVRADDVEHLTIAIDTPLGWPKAMVDLITQGKTCDVPEKADANPYLFRAQDRELFEQGSRPLSAVRDMIGSQSTKGMHFLQRAALESRGVGVWSNAGESVTALETYPTPALRDADIERCVVRLAIDCAAMNRRARNAAWSADVRDALACALVAHLYRRELQRLVAPLETAAHSEGWIWLPALRLAQSAPLQA